jgi:hypothetical protein
MQHDATRQRPGAGDGESPPYAANEVRLSLRQWLAVLATVSLVFVATPMAWKRLEPLPTPEDYRMPYALSEDYGLYRRLVWHHARSGKILVLGDSVVWGEYVAPEQTLTHWLNQQAATDRFANCGLNGAHPAALEGLVRYYVGEAASGDVLLHCNLLWLSSPEQDLRSDKEVSFNHPKLVPQFFPAVPAYRASMAERLGVVLDRLSPFRSWLNHVRIVYFAGQDLHSWSLEHPCDNPLNNITFAVPQPAAKPRHSAEDWRERGIKVQDFPWVDLESSLQWRAFRRTTDLIRRRGGRLFVLVGPLNQHMLEPASRSRGQALRSQVVTWLRDRGIPHLAPPVLPSPLYGDASHPLAPGYAQLAEAMLTDEAFQRWLSRRGNELHSTLATVPVK